MHSVLWDLWKQYLIIGGLPEVITDFAIAAESRLSEGFFAARQKQEQLIIAYEADIAKHSGKVNAQHIIRTLRAIPSKLSAAPHEGTQRFTFKDTIPGVRGYERLSGVIDWLVNSGLVFRLPLVKYPHPPLKGFMDEHLFKLFLFDTGIFNALSGINPATLHQFDFGMYKGFIAESFVLQELLAHFQRKPIVSWHTKDAEIEFVIENETGIIPIEVKSSHKFTSRSLSSFEKRFNPPASYVLSGNRGGMNGKRKELPLYLVKLLVESIA